MSVRRFARAKINLSLRVGPPHDDGRHPLQSIVTFADDVGDWLQAEAASTLSLHVDGPFASALNNEADNLVLRAARLLGANRGARLSLTKNLPVASGIGGGSADAAAALHALNELWSLSLEDNDLASRAAVLGADTPSCVFATACVMSGTGETTTPLSLPPLHLVLANPAIALSTRDVYERFDDLGLGEDLPAEPEDWRDSRNDLTAAAIDLAPQIADVLEALADLDGVECARLSGSGATCFAVVADRKSAEAAARELGAARPTWWIKPATCGAR